MSKLTDRLHNVLQFPKPIIHERVRWYYNHDLVKEVLKIQDRLAEAGIQSGDRILLSLPNSYSFVTIYLAIIDYGAVVVPIDPCMPEFEFKAFINRSRPVSGFISTEHSEFLLNNNTSDSDYLESFFVVETESSMGKKFVQRGGIWLEQPFEEKRLNPPHPQTSEESLAVLLYTSGTTGNPKAVGLTHGQILATVENIIFSHKLSSKDITYCFLPLFHINAQVVAILSTLLSAGKIVLAPKFSATSFWKNVKEHAITWVSAVPAVISILIKTTPPKEIPEHLRFIRSASAQLPMLHEHRFEQLFKVPIIQSYGMTEAASQICVNPLPPNRRVLGSVGLPIGVNLKIVGVNGEQVDPNQIGEIAIQGENVITHYVEAENQNDFQNGWFHTGDLGYVDKEGYVFIVGRKKEMINRGGEKISPYEVEDVIRQLPIVQETAVIGLPHPLYGEQVAAYIVSQDEGISPEEMEHKVISHCNKLLTRYKCPTVVKVVKKLPVGPTGKIQRNKLKEQELITCGKITMR